MAEAEVHGPTTPDFAPGGTTLEQVPALEQDPPAEAAAAAEPRAPKGKGLKITLNFLMLELVCVLVVANQQLSGGPARCSMNKKIEQNMYPDVPVHTSLYHYVLMLTH